LTSASRAVLTGQAMPAMRAALMAVLASIEKIKSLEKYLFHQIMVC